jgi:hypothetical protein
MVRAGLRRFVCLQGVLLCVCSMLPAQPQEPAPAPLNESGQILLAGRATLYRIRHLPLNSFPGLPDELIALLTQRGCLIPQTYEAHHPENVIHASLERPGSSDWAVLCSQGGTVSLLVFFSSAPAKVLVLASAPETVRLQAHDTSGVLGFNWGIDPASPEQILEAQAGLPHHPARVDHDALADSIVEGRVVYHFYLKNAWTVLEMPD